MNKYMMLLCCISIAIVSCAVDGATGEPGEQGDPGAFKEGPAGKDGAGGRPGDLVCGNDLISANEWHKACNVVSYSGYTSVGDTVCRAGQVQCRFVAEGEEIVPRRVCWDVAFNTQVVKPGQLEVSGRCDEDLDCNGNPDNTAGFGDNVPYTSDGRCDNARKHCLSNGTVGINPSDFVPAEHSEDNNRECASPSGTVKLWQCVVSGGVAKMECSKEPNL